MTLFVDADVLIETAVPADITVSHLTELLTGALRLAGADGDWTIEVLLTDDATVQRLHAQFMNLDTPTDILTFADEPPPGAPAGSGAGQIAISVEQAARQATEWETTLAGELRFLIVHGVLHLLGWDDDTPADRIAMLARQTAIVSELGYPLND